MAEETQRSFDWREARLRLERARQALESGGERTREEVGRILEERARVLARPLNEREDAPIETVEVLVFSVGAERYGIETSFAVEAAPLRGLVPVPRTPAFVAGVILHRGRVVPVLDLRTLLGLPSEAAQEGARAVVLEAAAMVFGVLADDVIGVLRIPVGELAARPAGEANRPSLVRAATPAAAILDVEALAADPRIVVEDRAD